MNKIFITLLFLFLPVTALAQDATSSELNLKDIAGRHFLLSDYRGKVVLINFWATWCPPCRMEIPVLVKLQRNYLDRGLRVIGMTYPPQELADVRRFVRMTKINYPVVIGQKETKLLFTSSQTLPMTVVIGRDGTVHDIIEGILLPEEFNEKIKPLLE